MKILPLIALIVLAQLAATSSSPAFAEITSVEVNLGQGYLPVTENSMLSLPLNITNTFTIRASVAAGGESANLTVVPVMDEVAYPTLISAVVTRGNLTIVGHQQIPVLTPGLHEVVLEVYLNNQLVDQFKFNVFAKLIRLSVEVPEAKVARGLKAPAPIPVKLINKGNEVLHSLKVKATSPMVVKFTKVLPEEVPSLAPGEIANVSLFATVGPQVLIGRYPFNITVTFKDSFNNTWTVQKSCLCEVTLMPTTIQLSIPAEVKTREKIPLPAYLLDENGNPVPQRPVLFYINDKFIGSNITDIAGRALLIYEFTDPGDYTVTVKFSGDDFYLPSTASFKLKATPRSLLETPLFRFLALFAVVFGVVAGAVAAILRIKLPS